MKYVVEVCYGNRNEWSNETEDRQEAIDYAIKMSLLAGVSETRVYEDDDIILAYYNGEVEDPYQPSDDWAEYDDRWDEVGYDPYTGGFDADL